MPPMPLSAIPQGSQIAPPGPPATPQPQPILPSQGNVLDISQLPGGNLPNSINTVNLQQALLNGQTGLLPPGQGVSMMDSNGNTQVVPEDQVLSMRQQGYAFDTPFDRTVQQQIASDGEIGAIFHVLGHSFVNNATFGLLRPLLAPSTPIEQAVQSQEAQQNPITNTIGSLAGGIVGAIGLNALTPEAAIAGVAGKFADAIDALPLTTDTQAAPLLAAVLRGPIGIRALQGGEYGAVSAISDLVYDHNPNQAAEHILAGLGVGGLFGGLEEAGGLVVKGINWGASKAGNYLSGLLGDNILSDINAPQDIPQAPRGGPALPPEIDDMLHDAYTLRATALNKAGLSASSEWDAFGQKVNDILDARDALDDTDPLAATQQARIDMNLGNLYGSYQGTIPRNIPTENFPPFDENAMPGLSPEATAAQPGADLDMSAGHPGSNPDFQAASAAMANAMQPLSEETAQTLQNILQKMGSPLLGKIRVSLGFPPNVSIGNISLNELKPLALEIWQNKEAFEELASNLGNNIYYRHINPMLNALKNLGQSLSEGTSDIISNVAANTKTGLTNTLNSIRQTLGIGSEEDVSDIEIPHPIDLSTGDWPPPSTPEESPLSFLDIPPTNFEKPEINPDELRNIPDEELERLSPTPPLDQSAAAPGVIEDAAKRATAAPPITKPGEIPAPYVTTKALQRVKDALSDYIDPNKIESFAFTKDGGFAIQQFGDWLNSGFNRMKLKVLLSTQTGRNQLIDMLGGPIDQTTGVTDVAAANQMRDALLEDLKSGRKIIQGGAPDDDEIPGATSAGEVKNAAIDATIDELSPIDTSMSGLLFHMPHVAIADAMVKGLHFLAGKYPDMFPNAMISTLNGLRTLSRAAEFMTGPSVVIPSALEGIDLNASNIQNSAQAYIGAVNSAATNPYPAFRLMQPMLQGLPKLTRDATGKQMLKGWNYLSSVAPQINRPSLFSSSKQSVIPTTQLSKFIRQVNIVNNPLGIIPKILNGTVTNDEIATLNTVYPNLHREIANKIMTSLAENNNPAIPYTQRMKLQAFLGSAIDPNLNGQTIASLQSTYAPTPLPGSQASPKAALKNAPNRYAMPGQIDAEESS